MSAERLPARARDLSLSAADLQAHAEALAAPLQGDTGARVSLLCFRAAGERFALPAACVERVFDVQPVRRVPHRSQPAFRGLAAHEGEIVPVGSLERLLGLAEVPATGVDRGARMLLLGPAGRGWAFQVHAVDGVVSLAEQDLRPAAATVTRSPGSATRLLARLPDGGEAAVLDPDALRNGWEAAAR
jgi:chemotaxis signal transduction protein